MRGILDGHIVMERAIAERGRYPAINVLKIGVAHHAALLRPGVGWPVVQRAKKVLATYRRHGGADPARRLSHRCQQPRSMRRSRLNPELEAFLAQAKDESMSLAEGYRRLAKIVGPAGGKRLSA